MQRKDSFRYISRIAFIFPEKNEARLIYGLGCLQKKMDRRIYVKIALETMSPM